MMLSFNAENTSDFFANANKNAFCSSTVMPEDEWNQFSRSFNESLLKTAFKNYSKCHKTFSLFETSASI
jgi:hypothetical protein